MDVRLTTKLPDEMPVMVVYDVTERYLAVREGAVSDDTLEALRTALEPC